MVSPIVICNGMFRSGSTWSFNVCRLLGELFAQRTGQTLASGYIAEHDLEQFLQAEAYAKEGPAVFKGHVIGTVALQWIRAGRARAVFTLRDPRDSVASLVALTGSGFDASVLLMAANLRWLWMTSRRDFGRALFICYERMINNCPAQIQRIAAHLDVPIDQNELACIDEQTSINTSRKLCRQINALDDEEAPVFDGMRRRHRTTLLHENHIGSAKPGRWKEDFTAAQGRYLTHLFANILLTLGYETQQSIQDYLGHAMPAAPSSSLCAVNDSFAGKLAA